MSTLIESETTMRDARARYFQENGFGPNGGYDEAWVDFMLGPIPMPFPNTKARVAAVGYHDLHHILTGYRTDFAGELEISAWELAAGCKGFGAAWVLNLGGLAAGLVRAPARVFAAFVRGRGDRTTYGEPAEDVLALTVAEARARFLRSGPPRGASTSDVALFALAAAAGIVVALALLALAPMVVPIGLLSHAVRNAKRTATSR